MSLLATEGVDALFIPSHLHNDAHFLRAVVDMADSQEVVARDAIYAESGLQLLEQGQRLDSRCYERLVQHRLAAVLDDQLQVQHVVDIRALEVQVHLLSGRTVLGSLLQQAMGDKHYMLLEVLRHMQWPPRASFKMTVMRHQLPDLFEHSLLMMMCAVYLGVKEKLSLQDCSELAAAALLHDVGMLFMSPCWRNAKHKLSTEERNQLAAHSVTGMLVVRSTGVYSARAEEAVLQHHERLDGSGYPQSLQGVEISPWGHILMLAEVISAFFAKFKELPAQRLSLMLRMNHNRFDARLAQHVHALLRQETATRLPADRPNHTGGEVREVVATLATIMRRWTMCKNQLPERWQGFPNAQACAYIDMRLQVLEKTLAESGSHPRQEADWVQIFEADPFSKTELVMINKEALWQADSCVQACLQRWPQLLLAEDALDEVLADWLVNCCEVLGHPLEALILPAHLLDE